MIGFSVKDIFMLQEFRMMPSSHVRSQGQIGLRVRVRVKMARAFWSKHWRNFQTVSSWYRRTLDQNGKCPEVITY